MGVRDSDTDKIQAYEEPGEKKSRISSTAQYALAGNSIVVDVLAALMEQMFYPSSDSDLLFWTIKMKHMDKQNLFETVITKFGFDAQKTMAVEECAELINALCKEKRGRATDEDIITEIADVQIMCEQLAIIYGKEKVRQERLRKLLRLHKRIQSLWA